MTTLLWRYCSTFMAYWSICVGPMQITFTTYATTPVSRCVWLDLCCRKHFDASKMLSSIATHATYTMTCCKMTQSMLHGTCNKSSMPSIKYVIRGCQNRVGTMLLMMFWKLLEWWQHITLCGQHSIAKDRLPQSCCTLTNSWQILNGSTAPTSTEVCDQWWASTGDYTFNLGPCFVTVVVYTKRAVIRNGSMYLHWDASYRTYVDFFTELRSAIGADIVTTELHLSSMMVLGSEEEKGLNTFAMHQASEGKSNGLHA